MKHKGAFIDRDGVLNEERSFVYRPQDFALIPGSVSALRALQKAGYRLVVVTNQSGIARGMYSEGDYQRLEDHMRSVLLDAGVKLDAVEHCPHGPDSPCECRKPRPGMILAATARLGIDLAHSILVGDRGADIEAGRAAGIGSCFLVRSGRALSDSDRRLADAVYDDLAQCAAAVLGANMPRP